MQANNANSVNSFLAFATARDLTSRFVNALRGAAAQSQSSNRDQQGMLKKLFGDIGSIGKLFGFT